MANDKTATPVTAAHAPASFFNQLRAFVAEQQTNDAPFDIAGDLLFGNRLDAIQQAAPVVVEEDDDDTIDDTILLQFG